MAAQSVLEAWRVRSICEGTGGCALFPKVLEVVPYVLEVLKCVRHIPLCILETVKAVEVVVEVTHYVRLCMLEGSLMFGGWPPGAWWLRAPMFGRVPGYRGWEFVHPFGPWRPRSLAHLRP